MTQLANPRHDDPLRAQATASRGTPDAVIYASDPGMAPDADFVPGTPAFLVSGNTGRMLDSRRTPVRVAALRLETGSWTCEVLAFEDAGARWELPFEAATRFQFARDSATLDAATLRQVQAVIRAFDRDASRPPDRRARSSTARRIASVRGEVADWLASESRFVAERGTLDTRSRDGSPLLAADLEAFMRTRRLWDVERDLAAALVSNPSAGEIVKVHAMALAELGLAGFYGTVVRDPASLRAPWTMDRRKEHIVTRLAFVRETFTRFEVGPLVLYRAISSEISLDPQRHRTLVSATFSFEVALDLFGAASDSRIARLDRQTVPLERIFMTYLETAAMNRQFHEAEALLLEDPENPAF